MNIINGIKAAHIDYMIKRELKKIVEINQQMKRHNKAIQDTTLSMNLGKLRNEGVSEEALEAIEEFFTEINDE